MSQAARYIRNGVHPRHIVEFFMGEPPGEEGSKFSVPKDYLDTRKPVQIADFHLNNGKRLPVCCAFTACGPKTIRLQKHKVNVIEMAAQRVTESMRGKPVVVIAMPGGRRFAQEVAETIGLPLRTDVFKKLEAIKGAFPAAKLMCARKNYRLIDRESVDSQSILLVDESAGSGAGLAACAELLYGHGAAYVIGMAMFG